MNDQYRIAAGGVLGALVGVVAGYFFFTEEGREVRSRIDPAVETIRLELARIEKTLEKFGAIANEGMRVANELGYGHTPSSASSRSTTH